MVHPLSIRYIVTGFEGIDNKLRGRGRKLGRRMPFSLFPVRAIWMPMKKAPAEAGAVH
jgi:hypothetical protein